jgi:hypothetical protein
LELKEEDKNYILSEYLRNIYHIASREYQIRVWIQGIGPEVDNFDESACHFFDDGDPILKNYKKYNISEKQLHLLLQLREIFDSFVNGNRPYVEKDFIDTPEWEKIMESAKDVLKAFNYQTQ